MISGRFGLGHIQVMPWIRMVIYGSGELRSPLGLGLGRHPDRKKHHSSTPSFQILWRLEMRRSSTLQTTMYRWRLTLHRDFICGDIIFLRRFRTLHPSGNKSSRGLWILILILATVHLL